MTQTRPQGGPEGAGHRHRGCEAPGQLWGRFQALQPSREMGTGDGLALTCARLCEETVLYRASGMRSDFDGGQLSV